MSHIQMSHATYHKDELLAINMSCCRVATICLCVYVCERESVCACECVCMCVYVCVCVRV